MYCGTKRLHIFPDSRFALDYIANFEKVFPGENTYMILATGETQYVKESDGVLVFKYYSKPLKKFVKESVPNFKEIVCITLFPELAKLVLKMNHPNISLSFGGSDLYESLLAHRGYKIYLDKDEIFKVRAQGKPLFLYKSLVFIRDKYYYYLYKKTLHKLNSIFSIKCDYEMLVKYFPEYSHFKPRYFFHYAIEDMLDDNLRNTYVSGDNIWVNNCAGINGNHIQVFELLKSLKVTGKVNCPLSYGDNRYAQYVSAKGYELLGNTFHPITTYLPKQDYYNLFLSSNSFIFGHIRQCAFGNILIALYLGAKVFLFESNPLYGYFKDMGLILYTIESDLSEDALNTKLPDDVRSHNREIIEKRYSKDHLLMVLKQNF